MQHALGRELPRLDDGFSSLIPSIRANTHVFGAQLRSHSQLRRKCARHDYRGRAAACLRTEQSVHTFIEVDHRWQVLEQVNAAVEDGARLDDVGVEKRVEASSVVVVRQGGSVAFCKPSSTTDF